MTAPSSTPEKMPPNRSFLSNISRIDQFDTTEGGAVTGTVSFLARPKVPVTPLQTRDLEPKKLFSGTPPTGWVGPPVQKSLVQSSRKKLGFWADWALKKKPNNCVFAHFFGRIGKIQQIHHAVLYVGQRGDSDPLPPSPSHLAPCLLQNFLLTSKNTQTSKGLFQ